jgi:acyl carrier protein
MPRRDEVRNALIANMRTVLFEMPDREVREDASLVKDFGADSLQIVEIVSRTMRAANVKVKRTELNKAKNIGELLDMLSAAPVGPGQIAAEKIP